LVSVCSSVPKSSALTFTGTPTSFSISTTAGTVSSNAWP